MGAIVIKAGTISLLIIASNVSRLKESGTNIDRVYAIPPDSDVFDVRLSFAGSDISQVLDIVDSGSTMMVPFQRK